MYVSRQFLLPSNLLSSDFICFKIEANQYILNRSGDIYLCDVDLVSLRGGKFDGHKFNQKKSHSTIKLSIKILNYAKMKIFMQDLC